MPTEQRPSDADNGLPEGSQGAQGEGGQAPDYDWRAECDRALEGVLDVSDTNRHAILVSIYTFWGDTMSPEAQSELFEEIARLEATIDLRIADDAWLRAAQAKYS